LLGVTEKPDIHETILLVEDEAMASLECRTADHLQHRA